MFSNIKETLYKFIAFAICGLIAMYAVIAIAHAIRHTDAVGLVIGLVFAAIAACLFAYLIIPAIGDKIAFGFYTPKNVKPLPPEFPVIRAKIARKEYAEAVADLKTLLEKDPGNHHVIALLVEVFVDRTDDYENAIGLITAYLKKDDRCEDDISIVMRLVDVYLDIDENARAAELLTNELKMKYAKRELEQIRKRLQGLV